MFLLKFTSAFVFSVLAFAFAKEAQARLVIEPLASVATQSEKPYDIKTQPLEMALLALAQRENLTLLVSSKQVKNLQAKSVQGHYSLAQALAVLLADTGLVATINDNKLTLAKVEKPLLKTAKALSSISKSDLDESILAEVVVTGQKVEHLSHFGNKQDNIQFTETFSLDSLSFQPSANLSERLVAVPGVTISRDSGEGRNVFLRGLHSSFTQTQVNGFPALFTGDSAIDQRGGANRSRSFDFNMFSPELFNKVQIHKSYFAKLDEGGIAGSVALTSRKPFDYVDQKWHGQIHVKAQHNHLLSSLTPGVSGFVATRTETLGGLFALDYSAVDTVETGSHVWHWTRANFGRDNLAPEVATELADALVNGRGDDRIFVPVGNSLSVWGNQRRRLSMSTAWQWQVKPESLLGLDLLVGNMSNDRTHYQLATAGQNGLIGDVDGLQVLTDALVQQQNLVYAQFDHMDLRSEHQKQQSDTDFYQVSWSWQQDVSDKLQWQASIGQSGSSFSAPVNDKVFLQARDHRVELDWRGGQLLSNYSGDMTDSLTWQLMRTDVREDEIENTYRNAKLDFSYQITPLSQFEFGWQNKQLISRGSERRSRVDWSVDAAIDTYTQLTELPLSQLFAVAEHSKTFAAIEALGAQSRHLTKAQTQPGTDYQISEQTTAWYGQVSTATAVAEQEFKVNLGVRYIDTKQRVTGQLDNQFEQTRQIYIDRYNSWLPSVNLSFSWSQPWLVRAAAYRNLARPDLNQLRPISQINVADLSIQLANPQLKPFSADSLDLALEYYQPQMTASISLYYKHLNDHIVQQSSNMSYRETGLPLTYLAQDNRRSPDSEFTLVQAVNSTDAYVRGVEFALALALPGPWQNWRVHSHVSVNSGASTLLKNGELLRVSPAGLSRLSYYGNLLYEGDVWQGGISATYRDKFVSTIGQTQNRVEGFDESLFVDLFTQYQLTSMSSLRFAINNLTDETLAQFQDDKPLVAVQSGRVYSLQFSYSFN